MYFNLDNLTKQRRDQNCINFRIRILLIFESGSEIGLYIKSPGPEITSVHSKRVWTVSVTYRTENYTVYQNDRHKKSLKSPESATTTSRSQPRTPRGREWQKSMRIKQTHVREANRPALSSPSDVITMLKGLRKQQQKTREQRARQDSTWNAP